MGHKYNILDKLRDDRGVFEISQASMMERFCKIVTTTTTSP